MVIRSLAMWFCVFALSLAHPSIASYLDGSFFSVGLDLGGGDALESERTVPDNNSAKVQAYQTEMRAYNEAIANLKNNQAQTVVALQRLIQQLQKLNPSSPTFDALITQIQAMIADPTKINLDSVTSSVRAYQNYLNQTFTQYQDANKQLLIQAQNVLNQYKQELGRATDQNQAILENAIKTFNDYNNQVAQIAKTLNIPYTPLALPPLLKGNVSNLTPSQVNQALSILSNDINHITSVVVNNANTINQADQKIVEQNIQDLTNLHDAKQTAINNVLSQITNITEAFGKDFQKQWVYYAQAHTYFLTNATHQSYINAGDTCVFQVIIYNNTNGTHHCGYQGGTSQALNQFTNQAAKYGLTPQDIWDTLFNIDALKNKVYIGPSNCSSGGCSGVSEQEAQNGMRNFFSFMNNYVGNSNFVGNFINSSLYKTLDQDLESEKFSAVTNFVNAYVNTFVPDMLQTFVLNPVWFMSVMPPGSDVPPEYPPPTSQEREATAKKLNIPALTYCYESQSAGLSFSQGYGVCQYNWWAHAIFLGYFGFLNNQTGTVISDLQSALGTVQTSITDAQNATNAYNNFKPQKIPNAPIISPYSTTPTPMPIPPVISGSANPLPQLIKPKAPVITFSSRNLNMHSLQFGLQAQGGHQKYFNPFFGISYYSSMSYRYLYIDKLSADSNLNAINHYAFGIGTNLLFNFYSKIRKPKFGHPIIRTYGFFTGLLGVFNLYNATSLGGSTQFWRKSANIDGVFGLSMRVDRFKWMLGVKIPFINSSQLISISGKNGTETLSVIDNYKSSNLFLDFLTFF